MAIVAVGLLTAIAAIAVVRNAGSEASVAGFLPSSTGVEADRTRDPAFGAETPGAGSRAGAEGETEGQADADEPTEAADGTTTSGPAAPTTVPIAPFEGPVIASPVAGEVLAWDAKNTFSFNRVPGATSYCLTLTSEGDAFRRCTRTREYDLIRRSKKVAPGPVTAMVEVFTESGQSLAVDEISIDLLHTNIALDVNPDRIYRIRHDTLIVKSRKIPTADDYCWVIIQDHFETPRVCSADDRSHAVYLRSVQSLLPGPAVILYVADRAGDVVGEQAVTITFG